MVKQNDIEMINTLMNDISTFIQPILMILVSEDLTY